MSTIQYPLRTAALTIALVSFSAHAQEHRIVGGSHAMEGEYPWMVEMLFLENEHLCGATLIHPEWVLTAGHCALVGDGADLRLIANSLNNTTTAPGTLAEELLVDTIYYHPDYDGLNGPDLALIHLAQAASTPVVPLLNAGVSDGLDPGDMALALGWGNADTVIFGPSDTLRAVMVPLVDFAACAALYDGSTSDLFNLNGTTGLLCAAGEEGQAAVGSGNGDSGGPLLIEQEEGWVQAGVVYGGEGQYATAEFPGVYTSVPYNRDWIEGVITGTISTTGPNAIAATAQVLAGADGLRVELPEGVPAAQLELLGVDGRLLARVPVSRNRGQMTTWPGDVSMLIARVLSPEGRVLLAVPVVRSW